MATVLRLPPRKRAEAAGRDMTRTVLDVLNGIRHIGGLDAFDTAAKQLLVSVSAAVSHLEGTDRLYYLLDLIEHVNSPEIVKQRRNELKLVREVDATEKAAIREIRRTLPTLERLERLGGQRRSGYLRRRSSRPRG